MDAAALVLAPKKPVAVRYFLSFQEQLLARRGVVVQSVNQESRSVDE